jgi:hypothetical protein
MSLYKLHTINTLSDPLIELIRDDPVRPEIPCEFRVSQDCEVFVLLDELYAKPQAVVCAAYKDSVPKDLLELAVTNSSQPTVAVFYTIWSYAPGAGRRLIREACANIKAHRKNIAQYVTLSPPTDMAREFHTRNGALVLSVNSDTVNYQYTLNND